MGDGCTIDHPLLANFGRRYFPRVLYKIVNDRKTNSVISWGENGKSFIIWDQQEFCRDLLPRVVRISSFPIFVKRLETYGFTKVESDHFEYANDDFVKGKPKLALEIHKRFVQTLIRPNSVFKPLGIEPAALKAMMKQYKECLPPGTFDFKPSLRDPDALRAHLMDAMKQGRAVPKDPLSLHEKEVAATLMADLKDVIKRRKAFLMEALAAAGPSSGVTQ
ncbi:Heat shock factor (HSF)-type DNA-binding [Arabidopsis suecica]|uniref:Heat shock factor (HSF)-type DNA-binding n=1 Tax=Arabidopsis suecica TaxID=45249 RepID=A0A8T1YHE8_ARASU|nr:Heat shock factor (HSF)-type DNA-binding [Arabidopsis suecica]KAG7545506.1 Heat shock factor (HSF)-type DNA-binding [Arabidopsis suecica]